VEDVELTVVQVFAGVGRGTSLLGRLWTELDVSTMTFVPWCSWDWCDADAAI